MAVSVNTTIESNTSAADNAVTAMTDYLVNAEQVSNTNQDTLFPDIRFPSSFPEKWAEVNEVTPPPFDPTVLPLTDQFQYNFTNISGVNSDLSTWMNNTVAPWIDTNFPMLDPTVVSAENTWLLDVVQNGYSGIPAAIEQLLWDRARSKDTIEALRLEDEAVNSFAARGFSLPPGALANRALLVQRDAANKASTIARDQAIKQIDTAIEMTKLAITEITKLRLGLADVYAKFMRAWLEVPKTGSELAKIKSDMYRTLWDAAANYGNMQANIRRAQTEGVRVNLEEHRELEALNVQKFTSTQTIKVNQAMSSATAYATLAAAARGANNTLVGAIENQAL